MPADHSHAAGQQGTGNQRSVSGHWEGEKNWEQSVQSAGGRWMMCLHWHQHNWEILTQHCVRRWKIKFVHPLELEFLHCLFQMFIHKYRLCLHLCHTCADDYSLTTFHVFPPKANDGLNLATHRTSCSSNNLQLMCPLAVYVTYTPMRSNFGPFLLPNCYILIFYLIIVFW